ncbi:DUF4956 domain-containing protein [Candidatus Pelagibacter ubique]|nr:DUF4956 domain-containing protein [Candidatus Pelagibacter ubique]
MIEIILAKFSNGDKLLSICLLIAIGLLLRITLEIFGQTWIKTKAHTSTIIILPIITYVITNVISGNIALSLGMVGALSIVRFRNPVRSPLELSVYFGSITMGIAASVSLEWLLFLVLSISIAIFSLMIADFLFQKILKRPFFIASFSEGNSLSSLTVVAKSPIDILDSNKLLQFKTISQADGIITYQLVSSSFSLLKQIEEDKLIRSKSLSMELRR